MSKLKRIREQQHLTQQELSERSGISVRTIQRIEAGTEPKGQTLKMLASTLEVKGAELVEKPEAGKPINLTLVKIINFSSLPVTIFPPANIILPLLIMWLRKECNPITRQIISLQIIWSIGAFSIFMLFNFMKNWFSWSNEYTLVMMILLVLSNVFIILRNAVEIDHKQRLKIKLSFSVI